MATPGSEVMTSGLDAWRALRHCGLEAEGRDQDFAESLRAILDPRARSLDEALAGSSVEQFVRAFLVTAEPYVHMLRGILRMFELAGANKGRAGWKIAFDGYEEAVEHFKQWEQIFHRSGGSVEHPRLSMRGFWEFTGQFREAPVTELRAEAGGPFWDPGRAQAVLPPPRQASEPWMHDVWAVIMKAQQILADAGLDLVTARAGAGFGEHELDGDAFLLANLRALQHDYQVSQLVAAYEALWGDAALQRRFAARVQAFVGKLPRDRYWSHVTVAELRPFLELPVWQRRHEFFAAWVASEQIDVFRELGIKVHSENGAITFPFRETTVATLAGACLAMIAERRTALSNPVGKGRTAGVQPDYGWWRNAGTGETCELVVEVKHYKKSASRPWSHVLTDYALAHPQARVLLVNYGPAGTAEALLEEPARSRCRLIGMLHPGSEESIGAFREEVRRTLAGQRGGNSVVMLDSSASMDLRNRRLAAALKELADAHGCRSVLAADSEILQQWDADALDDAALGQCARGRPEELAGPLLQALATYDAVILVSDDSGVRSIRNNDRLRIMELPAPAYEVDLRAVRITSG